MTDAPLPALITAGGRLSGAFAERCGTGIKALALLDGQPMIRRVITALRDSGVVSAIGVVGPVDDLRLAGIDADIWIDEGATGPQNILRGIAALRAAGSLTDDGRMLLCASDMAFLHADTVRELCRVAAERANADIVFPIVRGEVFDAAFPGSANVYAPLADGAFTGCSLQIVRPAAIEENSASIEKAFAARKSQLAMARLLGLGTIVRFLTRTLTVATAGAKVSAITGLRLYTPVFADARIAADVDSIEDYEFACRHIARAGTADRRETVFTK